MTHDYRKLYVGGEWIAPAGTDVIAVTSPATEEVIGSVPDATAADVDAAVAAARHAFDHGPWPLMAPDERADAIERLSAALKARAKDLARLITEEVGTPIAVSQLAQVSGARAACDAAARVAREFPFTERREGAMGTTTVVAEPVGVVAAIVPWNYPLVLSASKVAPALAAGCTVILKPAPDAPINAFVLAEAVAEAGLPPGVFNLVSAHREVSEYLVIHPGVDKVSFTGSTAAGRRIMALCGDQVKRVTLELGGKSACILLDDALLDTAVPMAAMSVLFNSGQTCVAQTRLIVPRATHDEVVERVAAVLGNVKVGDPLDPVTTMGPLVSASQRERVEDYIRSGQDEGAKLALGGGRPDGLDRGFYVEPTVFVGAHNKMRIAQEEIFGPVLTVLPHAGDDDAIAIANDSIYGLSGAVWTADDERGMRVARRVRTGTFGVNTMPMAPDMPFGGFKQSGIGREGGEHGLRSYLEYKSVVSPPRRSEAPA